MLSARQVLRSEAAQPAAIALIVGAVLGVALAWALEGGDSEPRGTRSQAAAGAGRAADRAGSATEGRLPAAIADAALLGALKRGIDAAAGERAGTVGAAAWRDDGRTIVAGSQSLAKVRPWQLMQVPAAIASFTAGVPEAARQAADEAIKGSDRCAGWRAGSALQDETGGAPMALAAIRQVLSDAGASTAEAAASEGPPPEGCSADGTATTFDESEWAITDAVAMAHGLATQEYGAAGESVLELMREPKGADGDWGAGPALTRWRPAYAAGWGGTDPANYVASQIAVVDVAGSRIGLAVVFRPGEAPPAADPEAAGAPDAMEAVFGELGAQFEAAESEPR